MTGDVIELVDKRRGRRVVVTFPLRTDAERRLAELLGTGFGLVDVKDADGSEDIVLLPSTSRQLIGKLRAAFPDAALLVVEVEDPALGVDLGGQVLRSLDAGADGYFAARSIDELASIVDRASGRLEPAESSEPAALSAGHDDELSAILDRLVNDHVADPAPSASRGETSSDH